MSYPINATFIDEISFDIPSSNWSLKQWAKDLNNMKKVGINTVVIMRTVFYGKCIYNSKHFASFMYRNEDFLDFIMSECDKKHINVYVGLHIKDLTWGDGDYEFETKENDILTDEILSSYNHHKSFVGWYIPHETSINNYNIIPTMTNLCKMCKEKSPDKKVIISPFFRSRLNWPNDVYSPEKTFKTWDEIFASCGKYIDICAFQDGTVYLEDYESYLKEVRRVCDKYKIDLWANVETFERDVRNLFFPIQFEILKKKIDIAKPYVKGMITFEFSHFLSPQSIFESGRNLNKLYTKFYK